MPGLLQPLRDLVLEAQVRLEAGNVRESGGRWGFAFEPGADGVVGELGMVVHERPVDVRTAHGPVRADHDLDDDGGAVLFGLRDVRSVERGSGNIGKICAAV